MSIVAGKKNAVTVVVQAVNLEAEKNSELSQTIDASGIMRHSNSDNVLMLRQNAEVNLDDLQNGESLDSLLSGSETILDRIDDYGYENDSEVLTKISVDDLGCDIPKFIISENLKDADGSDLFIVDSATGKLRMTEAGVNSFINDAESLPDLHPIDVQVQGGHGVLGIKEMILVEKSLSSSTSIKTNGSDSIDALLYGDDDVKENDLFEFLETNSDLVL